MHAEDDHRPHGPERQAVSRRPLSLPVAAPSPSRERSLSHPAGGKQEKEHKCISDSIVRNRGPNARAD